MVAAVGFSSFYKRSQTCPNSHLGIPTARFKLRDWTDLSCDTQKGTDIFIVLIICLSTLSRQDAFLEAPSYLGHRQKHPYTMGNGESKPKETKDADVIDPDAKAASMLAKQMVRGPVRFQQLPEATGDTAEEAATAQKTTDETKEVSAILKSGVSVVRTAMGTYGGREGVVAGALTQAIFCDLIDEMFPSKSSTPNTDDMKKLVNYATR
ncbi:uncharacterized protein LOC118431635 [Branchiostoma floridae]|uniref:Uncharacterized protein LOC118431635 n=1 Tax=Branchiostoma floridae TaxID=7739 RepID=A0A9J7MGF6_BRAFL|nr:uncharacterized protein LOC118431635 [Branchiostoma floridae]